MALPTTTYDTATVSNPSAALTDFSLMIDLSRLSTAWWTAVGSETDGTKGRAAKDDGTELAVDWIDFDSTADTGWARVKWSGTLATSGTQTIRLYPPVSGNASVAASATFGSDNAYDSSWTVYYPDGSGTDRISTPVTLTNSGGMTSGGVTGKVGDATSLDGSNDYATGTTTATPGFTMMAWANPDVQGTTETVMAVGDFDAQNHYVRLFRWSADNKWGLQSQLSTGVITSSISYQSTATTWQHVVGVVESDTVQRLYVDANSIGPDNTDNVTWANVDTIAIGASLRITSTPDEFWNGLLDEVQLHATTRSGDWISHEYAQTNDNATFWGTWTNVPVGGGSNIPAIMHHRRLMGVS